MKIKKSDFESPAAVLALPNTWKKSLGPMPIKVNVDSSSHRCSGNETTGEKNWRLRFRWRSNEQLLNVSLQNLNDSTGIIPLNFPLSFNQSYLIECLIIGYAINTGNVLFTVIERSSFRLLPSDIVVKLFGGNSGNISRHETLLVDSRATIDPDELPLQNHRWQLYCSVCSIDNLKYIALNTSTLTIPANTFNDNVTLYIAFSITTYDMTRGLEKTAHANLSVFFYDAEVPKVECFSVNSLHEEYKDQWSKHVSVYDVLTPVRIVSSVAISSPEVAVSSYWSCGAFGDAADTLNLHMNLLVLSKPNDKNLVLNSSHSVFATPRIWECARIAMAQFSTTSTTSSASVLFRVNIAPRLGDVNVFIKRNDEADSVDIIATRWQDEDTPLLYSFSVVSADEKEIIISSKSVSSRVTAQLPSGTYKRAFAYVEDVFGAVGFGTSTESFTVKGNNAKTFAVCNATEIVVYFLQDSVSNSNYDNFLLIAQEMALSSRICNGTHCGLSNIFHCASNETHFESFLLEEMTWTTLRLLNALKTKEDFSKTEQLLLFVHNAIPKNAVATRDSESSIHLLGNVTAYLQWFVDHKPYVVLKNARVEWYKRIIENVVFLQTLNNGKNCEYMQALDSFLLDIFSVSMRFSVSNEQLERFKSQMVDIGGFRAEDSRTFQYSFAKFSSKIPASALDQKVVDILIVKSTPRSIFCYQNSSKSNNVFGDTYNVVLKQSETSNDIRLNNTSEPVILTFRYLTQSEADAVNCQWFSDIKNEWTSDGCVTKIQTDTAGTYTIVCECNHLTEFALLYSASELSGEVTYVRSLEGLENIVSAMMFTGLLIWAVLLAINMALDPKMIGQVIRMWIYSISILYSTLQIIVYSLFAAGVVSDVPLVLMALLALVSMTCLLSQQSFILWTWKDIIKMEISSAKVPLIEKIRKPVLITCALYFCYVSAWFLLLLLAPSKKFLDAVYSFGSISLSILSAVISLVYIAVAAQMKKTIHKIVLGKKEISSQKPDSLLAMNKRVNIVSKILAGCFSLNSVLYTVPLFMESGFGKLMFVHVSSFLTKFIAECVILKTYTPKTGVILICKHPVFGKDVRVSVLSDPKFQKFKKVGKFTKLLARVFASHVSNNLSSEPKP